MKKILIATACILAVQAKAQTGKTVVYIPATNACYEASSISTVSNGGILTLTINDAVAATPTSERIKVASSCTKGEFRNDDSHGGTHNVDCDETVATTCFCTGKK